MYHSVVMKKQQKAQAADNTTHEPAHIFDIAVKRLLAYPNA
jgi:hypothetical protein